VQRRLFLNHGRMKTGVFVGRFQPFHDGHKKCIQKILETCGRCIVMMRETPQTEKNPFDLEKRKGMIRAAFPNEEQVIIMDFSDPGAELSVFIGRDVGYELIQLDAQTESISATDIRKKLYTEAGKTFDPNAHLKVK
jgi:adenylylsulfate kinase